MERSGGEERRRHKRFKFDLGDSRLYIIRDIGGDLKQEDCLLENLSHSGMCIRVRRSLPKGVEYLFWVELFRPALGSAVVKGTPVWTEEDVDEGICKTGIAFTATSRAWLAPYLGGEGE